MRKRWDWSNDRSLLEWMAELIGVKLGLAPSEERIRAAVQEYDHLLPDGAHMKVAYQELGYSVLEHFGLDGARRVLNGSIVHDVEARTGDLSLAIQGLGFAIGRILLPSHGNEFIESMERGNPYRVISYAWPLMRVDSNRAQGIIAEAADLYGKLEAEAVSAALDEILFRANCSVVLFRSAQFWDDVIDLSELFATESILASYGKFFDQRFINYLASNVNEVASINWRRFEALVAEYFHRQGFEVQLGAGRNDDGVDIRAWDASIGLNSDSSPPTLLIQCKREKQKTGKVVVKSLAADVRWEKADRGLLVTTAEWSPGARKVVSTRGYPLEEINGTAVRRWLVEMRDNRNGLWYPQ